MRQTMSNETQNTISLSKWQIGLMIGTPIVLGTGYYLYRRHNNSNTGVNNVKPVKKTIPKTVILDPIDEALKKAVGFKTDGNKSFKRNNYLEAIDLYTKAINACPQDKNVDMAMFYQNRAASYEALGKYDEVVNDCNEAVKFNSRYLKALARRAKAHESLGDLSKALNDITSVCILEQFRNKDNLMATDRLLKQQSKAKAKELVKTRPPKMPSKHFIRQYVMSYSRDPLFKSGDLPDIEEMLNKLKQQQEEAGDAIVPEYALLKGTTDILMGNILEAEKELEKVAKLVECDTDVKVNALIKLGTIKVQDIGKSDNVQEALKCFEEAIKLDADNPDIYLHRAQIHLLSESVEKARRDLEKCCALDPNFASALSQKLYVQFRCGVRFNDETATNNSMQEFKNAITKFPNSSEVYSLYAQALMENGNFNEADQYFKKAIKIDPIDGNLYVHRGILYLQWDNKIDKAVEFLEKAKEVDPNCQFAFEMLGNIAVQNGNMTNGIEYFEKAIELAQTEFDCAHLFSLRDAADAQLFATKLLGIELPPQ